MLVKFAVNKSSKNTIGKDIIYYDTFNLRFRGDFNITNPIIRLVDDGLKPVTECNYFEIVDLSRKYFIKNVTRVSNTVIELVGECDLLETFKDEILNSVAKYNRNIKTGDYLDTTILSSVKSEHEIFNSNKGLALNNTMILTSIGV